MDTRERARAAATARWETARVGRDESALSRRFNRHYTREEKGRIAESAVLLRLCLNQLIVYASPFDGERDDWLVTSRGGGRFLRIQVRWMSDQSTGNATLRLTSIVGGRRVARISGYDVLVGYHFFSDTCHVWTAAESAGHTRCLSASRDSVERWDKIHAGMAER